MEHPILLGRKFIQDKFVVDVSRFDLSQKKKVIVINENGKPERGKSPLQIKAKKQDV
jgi:hypothetical protein